MPEAPIDWLACAHEAVRAWPINPTLIKFVNHAENVTFQTVDATGEKYVLRIHRPEYHTLEELNSEQLWTEALRAEGIDVPEAVKTTNSERYAQVKTNGQVRNVGLLKWVEGRTLRESATRKNQDSLLETNFENIGRLLAALHRQAVNWETPRGFKRHSLDANGFMGEAPFWGRFWEADDFSAAQKQRMRSMRRTVYPLLANLPKHASAYSLIHADLHTGNVVEHDSELHIIDFDDAGFGWHAYDFAVALAEHFGPIDSNYQIAKTALFRGYEQVRSLEPWVKAVVPLFNLVRPLASIGWLDARAELKTDPSVKIHLLEVASSVFDEIVQTTRPVIENLHNVERKLGEISTP